MKYNELALDNVFYEPYLLMGFGDIIVKYIFSWDMQIFVKIAKCTLQNEVFILLCQKKAVSLQ